LLHSEQGLGDTLQFIRYALLVKARGGRVIVGCQPSVYPLVATCAGIDELFTGDAALPLFDTHAALLSLPWLLGTTLATIPADVPYLFADADLVEHWRKEIDLVSGGVVSGEWLAPKGQRPATSVQVSSDNIPLTHHSPLTTHHSPTLNIGIAWQGNPAHVNDLRRSAPLAAFEPLARMERVCLFSLQKGPGSEQLAGVAERWPIVDWGSRLQDFRDTAAASMALDLVITIDSAVAHCAGALGAPVWVLLPFASEWRWLLEREDCPWYPTMRLFRQPKPGEWGAVFERVLAAVKERFSGKVGS
jgi:hypothetical protein